MSTVRSPKQLPPLENGDRLSRAEFERRYKAMPHVKKAELIEGEVFMGSPVSWEGHGEPHVELIGWLAVYKAATPGITAADNATVRLDSKNEPQPDAALIVRPEYGGQVRKSGKYVAGAPELVAEISGSSAGIDLNRKLEVYRRNGVREYIVWRTYDEALDWFVLRNEEFVPLEPDPADGLLKSIVFPGLWLDSAALVKRDLAKVLAALARGTASPEHAAFVQQLAARLKI
jgi:Uma2 family endonuclease